MDLVGTNTNLCTGDIISPVCILFPKEVDVSVGLELHVTVLYVQHMSSLLFVSCTQDKTEIFQHIGGSVGASLNQLWRFSWQSNTISCCDVLSLQPFPSSCHHINILFQAKSNTMQLCTFCVARILSDTLVLIIISNVIFLCECFLL